MRRARVKVDGSAYYHVMSRCALQQFLLEGEVKGMFLRILRRAEIFSGVRILNYCVMDNHFHLLLHVPARREVSDAELDERITVLYGARKAGAFFERWEDLRARKLSAVVEGERAAFRRRMYDLSEFMKTFKQRFSLWYCTNHGNLEGTIWQGPFHSVLVEGSESALGAISAYITLNPVRAKIVEEPGDYAWSGYGAAAGGDAAARAALLGIYPARASAGDKWRAYRSLLDAVMAGGDSGDSQPGAGGDSRRAGSAADSGGVQPGAGLDAGGGLRKAAAVAATGSRGGGRVAVAETHGEGGGAAAAADAPRAASIPITVLRLRDKDISRGVAFGSWGHVAATILRFRRTPTTLTAPRPCCMGMNRQPLFCAARRVKAEA